MFARLRKRIGSAHVIAFIALVAALTGTSIALPGVNSVDSRDIRNRNVRTVDLAPNAVTTSRIKAGAVNRGRIAPGAVTSARIAPGVAVAKGFAVIDGANANGAATVLTFGGQQTAADPPGVTAEREVSGSYLVTFEANDAPNDFVNVDGVDDVAVQATGENFSNASAQVISASEDEIQIRVRLRTFNGANPANEDFSVAFFIGLDD